MAKIMNDLPAWFDIFRQTLTIQVASGTQLSTVEVQELLLLVEDDIGRETIKDTIPTGGDAFVHQAKWKKPADQKEKETRSCYNCGNKGHFKNVCRSQKKVDGQQGQTNEAIGFHGKVKERSRWFRLAWQL